MQCTSLVLEYIQMMVKPPGLLKRVDSFVKPQLEASHNEGFYTFSPTVISADPVL